MNNRILPLSLLIGAALTIPTLAMAAGTKAVDAESTVKVTAEVESGSGSGSGSLNADADVAESKIEKLSPFAISETQTISRARSINNNIAQQPMTTEIKAPAEALQEQALQTTEVISEDAVLDAPEDLAEVSEQDDL